MNPIHHPSTNDVLGAPPGVPIDQCRPFYITRIQYADGSGGVASFWQPTPEELALLNAGKPVRLTFDAPTHFPVYVGVDGDGLLEV
jgi:hypothetical protein